MGFRACCRLRLPLGLLVLAAGCASVAATLSEADPALAPAPASAPELATRVWVNTNSNVYHCLGSADYGSTAAGAYRSEADARTEGARPARNQICGPPQVWVNLKSSIYHCPGAANYGTTAEGAYVAEAEAQKAGARPAGGRPCFP